MKIKRGFTLIELSMVVAVMAIMAGVVVPNYIRSVRIEAGKKAALEISQIAEASRAYYVDQKGWPVSLDELAGKGFMDNSWSGINPFGKAYTLEDSGVNLAVVTEFPTEIAPVVSGLLPMALVSGGVVRVTVTVPGSSGEGVPAGVIVPWGSANIPSGWFICDGREVSRVDAPGLFAAIGTTYGHGDGHNTFNLPDLRGRAAVGMDDMGRGAAHVITDGQARVLGGMFGAEKHRLTAAEMPSHTHSYGLAYAEGRYDGHSSPLYNFTTTAQSGSAGGDQPHNNIQPSMALYWIIKG